MKKHYQKISRQSRANKRDCYTACSISLPTLRLQLRDRGFEDIKLQQIWRNVHGTVGFEGRTCFFKMASTPGISRGARNEVRWNQHIDTVLTALQRKIISVPKVLCTGVVDGCFFYVSEFLNGRFLADQSEAVSQKGLAPWVDDITESWLVLSEVKPAKFVWDLRYSRVQNPGRKFFKRAQWFYSSLKNPELAPLLIQAQAVEQTYIPALNHGDMTPWHYIARKSGGLCLIDAEHASSALPRYYDVAYFFHRLATMGDALELGKKFLASYRSKLDKKGRNDFDKRFVSILAERVLGGFWDVTRGGNHATGRNIRPYSEVMTACLKRDLY